MTASNLPPVRRIVTSHNSEGSSTIQSDTELVPTPIPSISGAQVAPIWKTLDGLPTGCNNTSDDWAKREMDTQENFGLVPAKGANVQITEMAPGVTTPNHRTSSVDYNVLLAGEVTLIMEDGSTTVLKQPGDNVVMKGGLHMWKNTSDTEWCRWMTVLTSAEPVVVNGKALGPEML